MLVSHSPFLPFVLGEADNLIYLPDKVAGLPLVKIPIHHASVQIPFPLPKKIISKGQALNQISPTRFSRLLNIANAYAYGDQLGMPEWVMLFARTLQQLPVVCNFLCV